MKVKPPIGIMPQWIWSEKLEVWPPSDQEVKDRVRGLRRAIARYEVSPYAVPVEWINELKSYLS